jgi:probable HAF family extracellular repeat protein
MQLALSRAVSAAILFASAAMSFVTPVAAQPPRYSVIDIPALGGLQSIHGFALNDRGDVVGFASTGSPENSQDHAFFFDFASRSVNELDTFGGTNSDATGVNNAGKIVGNGNVADLSFHAFTWESSGGGKELGPYPNGTVNRAGGINRSGTVVALARLTNGSFNAVLINDLTMTPLGTVGGSFSVGYALSDEGHATGESATPNGQTHAFLYGNGMMQDLGTLPGGTRSVGFGVNNNGEVVGNSDSSLNGPCWRSKPPCRSTRATVYRNGQMVDLGGFTEFVDLVSSANGINDRGEIVGSSELFDADGFTTLGAFVFMDGRMENLTSLIDPADPLAPFVRLSVGTAINCQGWIVANGVDTRTDFTSHAYLLIPNQALRPECPNN